MRTALATLLVAMTLVFTAPTAHAATDGGQGVQPCDPAACPVYCRATATDPCPPPPPCGLLRCSPLVSAPPVASSAAGSGPVRRHVHRPFRHHR